MNIVLRCEDDMEFVVRYDPAAPIFRQVQHNELKSGNTISWQNLDGNRETAIIIDIQEGKE